MCDLIDLNSPDPQDIKPSKLASPLIPGPSTPVYDQSLRSMEFVAQGKRSSLENNPFDKVLKQTAEYLAKKDDPFEAVLEKALRSEELTPRRRRRHSDVLKMNKTMEEPLLQGMLNKNLNHLIKMAKMRDGVDLGSTASPNCRETEDLKFPNIFVVPPSPGDCSVLNQSAMNDSLSEVSDAAKPKYGRSLSQGIENSPQNGFRRRSKSTIDTLKVDSQSRSRGSSVSSTDIVNTAFIETRSSVTSAESFNLSSISATPSSLQSHGSKNRAFILDSQSSISKSNSFKTPSKTRVSIADLELKLEKLRKESLTSVAKLLPSFSPNCKVKNFLHKERTENKLIDTENEHADSIGKEDSTSNCSSDSVFENEKVNPSIFKEAKLLAKTFDELALQSTSTSFSSGDDLLSSRPPWNFDVLPASDEEEANLIDLPPSPGRIEGLDSIVNKEEVEKTASDEIKDLESQFIDQDIARNKIMASTLLLDLEKIVHRENNPEAITLLENLEKVLGVKYESNSQLLATCVQWTNNLSKSPKKCMKKLGSSDNIRNDSLENSHEDNNEAVASNEKIIKICNNENLELNLNVEKEINKSEKSIIADFTQEEKENLTKEDKHDEKISVDQTEALELITNLSKILGGSNNESSPLSLLTNLRQVLNLATNQLNFENAQITKSEDQESPKQIETGNAIPQKKSSTKQKVDPIKSGRKKSLDPLTKTQINDQSSTKRSMSLGSVQRSNVVASKEKIKPNTRSIKKALSCDAVVNPDTQEKLSSITKETVKSRVSSFGVTGKYKLKKKPEAEGVGTKKGPLKALIPVGNMQRRGSMISKVAPISLSRTPPKSSSERSSAATSSTPNPTVSLISSKKSPKTKPVASSTPDGSVSKTRNMRLQFSRSNSKPKFSCNISPVTPLAPHSITGSAGSKASPKNYNRHNKTLSPPKRRGSHEAQALNTTESGIPKYSPLVGFSRRNSKESVKILDNSGSPKTSLVKSQTPKKSPALNYSGSQIPQSPLKPVNNQNSNFKPFNLISKFRRGSNSSNVSDKENVA